MNHHLHITGLDTRRTHFASAQRTARLALAATIAAILTAHIWLLVAFITP